MSSGMYGADVAQLRELARGLQSASDQLDGARQRVGGGIRIAAWMGPVAVRFRLMWDSEYSRLVQTAADDLERIAREVLADAEEQERASARDGGAAGLGGGGGGSDGTPGVVLSPADLAEAIRTLLGLSGLVSDGGDYVKALQEILEARLSKIPVGWFAASGLNSVDDVIKHFKSLGGVATVAGFAFNAWDMHTAIQEGDTGGQVEAFLDTGAGIAGLFIPGAGLAWEGGKIIGTGIYEGVNTFYDSPGGALSQGARAMFGDDARLDTLTAEQHAQLAARYDGIGGFGLSILDGALGMTNDFGAWMETRR